VAVNPPGLEVTVYPIARPPPLLTGAVNVVSPVQFQLWHFLWWCVRNYGLKFLLSMLERRLSFAVWPSFTVVATTANVAV
jgi:hypothetical protein